MNNPLLKWAIANGATANMTQAGNIDPSKKEAFESLYKQVSASDVDKMKIILKHFIASDSVKQQTECLEALQYFVEDIDNAKSFVKIDGLTPVISALESTEPEVAKWAAWVIASLAQNNPELVKAKALTPLLPLLKSPVDAVRSKALYAISGIVQGCQEGAKIFKENSGVESLLSLMESGTINEKRKSLHILDRLAFEYDDIKDAVLQSNFMQLFDRYILCEEDLDIKEKSARLLRTLLKQYKAGQEAAKGLGTKEKLAACLGSLDANSEDFVDVLAYLREIKL